MGKTQRVSDNAIPKPKKLVRISNMLPPPSRLSICEVELPDPASGFAATLATPLLSALHRSR